MGLVLRRRKIMGDELPGYQIERSLRFNRPDNPYLSRTPGVAGNRKTWTFSFWIKRAMLAIPTYGGILSAHSANNDAGYFLFAIPAADTFSVGGWSTTYRGYANTFSRDPTAWVHVDLAVDTTQATGADRMRLYINNALQTPTSGTDPALNADLPINGAILHAIGRQESDNTYHLDGYLADVAFIDGQALPPSSFGETDATTGQWKPKDLTGLTFGAQGYWLKFADNSNTTAATLGKDSSGNANNWTPNGFSVTAGAGNDSLTDTPTNYGNDSGLGGEVRGNYNNWNPLDIRIGGSGNLSIVNGGLDLSSSNGDWNVTGTQAIRPGDMIYAECLMTAYPGDPRTMIGFQQGTGASSGVASTPYRVRPDGQKQSSGGLAAYGGSMASGGTVMMVIDRVNHRVFFGYNGQWANGSGAFDQPWASAVAAFTGLSATELMFFSAGGGATGTWNLQWNFGQRPFTYAAPSGCKCICTQNLPDPAIPNPKEGFEAKLRTGTGAAANVTGLLFSPGLYIGKSRSAATDWAWYDSVRGATKQVESNTTTAETTEATGVTAFNSDGISIGALAQLNTSAATYLDLFFRFGVSYGVGAVAYVGTGSNRTIAHPLGRVPKMIIVYDLTTGGSHRVYHAGMAATTPEAGVLYLDSTAAYAAAATVWNSTAPTASVFSVGTDARVNTNGSSYIAFVFADIEGFSAFGAYTGTNNTDGAYVHLGFKAEMLMIKDVANTYPWRIHDKQRSPSNPSIATVFPNVPDAEVTSPDVLDINAFGFKARSAAGINAATRHIYAAFAKEAGKYSRAA